MGNRTAKFVSVLVGSIIAGAPLAAVSQNAPTAPATSSTANAAADCLASPKGVAPQGQHWYYRLERSTKQKCWYLRAAGSKAAQTAQATPDAQAAQETDSASPQSVKNARAELVAPRSGAAPAAASAPPLAQQQTPAPINETAQQPAVATPWPDATAAATSPAPQPAEAAPSPQPAPAVVAAAAQPGAKPAKSPAPVALAAADGSADRPHGSLPMLLLVIGGALALAGVLASLIYRFAGARVRVQSADRHGYWDDWEAHDQEANRAPWLGAMAADAQPPQPVDFDAARPQPAKQVTKLAAIGREIELIDARKRREAVLAAEPAETKRDEVAIRMFDRKFQIEAAAPKLANESGEDRDRAAARDQDAVDVDVITTMLEQMAKEGPRLSRPNLEAELANFERSLRGRSAARA
ncbi:hypothetical protein LPJ38_22445 [Bradyrhizobium daqingense]|uniref:Uncharacterized protein n=1 Tax=Bradyrhizobium daqingense TaxID=993502 RepID=A0A562LGA3_9BRAD|nr:hypothetical protein [Bradyrhizobium daqingense]TWI06658.1 hypothetical protein IQ17_02873 [Bradyrhizobium daqingense]UFS86433.1 hypothetical protein LPJ38_22445 [Bradyrhizobium daqingense]